MRCIRLTTVFYFLPNLLNILNFKFSHPFSNGHVVWHLHMAGTQYNSFTFIKECGYHILDRIQEQKSINIAQTAQQHWLELTTIDIFLITSAFSVLCTLEQAIGWIYLLSISQQTTIIIIIFGRSVITVSTVIDFSVCDYEVIVM